MSRTYSVHLCGDSACPSDDTFVHRPFFGCVPANFSERTGRAKGHTQTETAIDGLPWKVWLWNGGCDATGETALRKLAEWERRDKTKPPIILAMDSKGGAR